MKTAKELRVMAEETFHEEEMRQALEDILRRAEEAASQGNLSVKVPRVASDVVTVRIIDKLTELGYTVEKITTPDLTRLLKVSWKFGLKEK